MAAVSVKRSICYRKKIDVSFSCVCPVIDNGFRHNIVKIACGSTRLSTDACCAPGGERLVRVLRLGTSAIRYKTGHFRVLNHG